MMGMTMLYPIDEANTHDEGVLNDEETSHH